MDWYYYIALAAILSQLVIVAYAYRNYRYALKKYKKKHVWHRSRTLLIVPCKGLDSGFQENISSFFNQDHQNYLLWFVVADKADPAYEQLLKLKDQIGPHSKARDIQILIAGKAQSCSQKIHNLLYCYENIRENSILDPRSSLSIKQPASRNDIEILSFADSDIRVGSDWLSHLVWPLRSSRYGAATGYRWFIPKNNNLASLALSAVNAKVAQLLGHSHFNQAWGGSMAIRVEVFSRLGLDKIWRRTFSDDFSLSSTVKKAGMKIAFVPACLAASYQSCNWKGLFEFARRQFVITRISAPRTWWFGLLSSLYSTLGIWATALLAVYAVVLGHKNLSLFIAVPVMFLTGQLTQAILRQRMSGKLLEKYLQNMKPAMAADILGFWIWSLLLLVIVLFSAFGRTICWRGIRYKLVSPTETIVIGGESVNE